MNVHFLIVSLMDLDCEVQSIFKWKNAAVEGSTTKKDMNSAGAYLGIHIIFVLLVF